MKEAARRPGHSPSLSPSLPPSLPPPPPSLFLFLFLWRCVCAYVRAPRTDINAVMRVHASARVGARVRAFVPVGWLACACTRRAPAFVSVGWVGGWGMRCQCVFVCVRARAHKHKRTHTSTHKHTRPAPTDSKRKTTRTGADAACTYRRLGQVGRWGRDGDRAAVAATVDRTVMAVDKATADCGASVRAYLGARIYSQNRVHRCTRARTRPDLRTCAHAHTHIQTHSSEGGLESMVPATFTKTTLLY